MQVSISPELELQTLKQAHKEMLRLNEQRQMIAMEPMRRHGAGMISVVAKVLAVGTRVTAVWQRTTIA